MHFMRLIHFVLYLNELIWLSLILSISWSRLPRTLLLLLLTLVVLFIPLLLVNGLVVVAVCMGLPKVWVAG